MISFFFILKNQIYPYLLNCTKKEKILNKNIVKSIAKKVFVLYNNNN